MTRYIQRHSLLTRVTHGVAAVACILLAVTGVFVFVPSLGGGIMGGEFTQTMRMYGLGRTSGGYIKKDIEAWLAAELNWETMDEEEMDLYPGIRVLNFGPGHAYGMMGLLVTLPGSGNYIVASDAVNTAMNYGPPMQYPGLAYDTRGFERTIDRIRKLENRYHAQVLFSHDIDQYGTYRKAPFEWYE